MNKELNISPKAFWDVDFGKLILQADNYSEFIIRKTFEYGTFNDILNVVRYFGKQKVIDTLTSTTYLSEKNLHFCAAFFNIEKSNFKCYTNKQQRHFYTKRSKI